MGREKKDLRDSPSGDSTATMIKRSLKYGLKSALKTATGGGMADQARKAIKSNVAQTQAAINKDTQ